MLPATIRDPRGDDNKSATDNDDETDNEPGHQKQQEQPSFEHLPPKLPDGYEPTDKDVICGRARENFHHDGNRYFRELIHDNIGPYLVANTKVQKSEAIIRLVDRIRNQSPFSGGFVKKEGKNYYRVNEADARDKVGHAVRKAAQRLRESKPKSFQKIKDKYANFWAKQLDDSTSNKLSSGNLSAASSDSSSGEKKPKANKRKLAHQSSFSDQHIAMAPSTSLREGSSLDTAKILDQTADLIQQGTTSQPLCGVGLSSQLPAGLAATGAGAGFRLSSLGASGLLLSAQGASASGDVLGAARNLDDSAHGGISSAASLGSQSSNISTFLRNQVRRPSAGPSSSLSSIPINQVDMLTNSHRMQQLLQHRQALIHGTSLLGPLGTAAATGSSEGTTSLPAASMLSQLISQQRQQQSASTADRDLLLLQALQQQQRARAATTESLRQSMIQDILAGGGSSQDVIQEQQRLLAARLGRPSSGDPTNMMSSSASTQDLQRLLDLQNALRGGTAMTTPRGTDLPTAASVTTAMMFPPSSTSSSQQQPQDLMSQRLLQYQTLLQGAGASSNLNPATTHGEEKEEEPSKKKQKKKEEDNDDEKETS